MKHNILFALLIFVVFVLVIDFYTYKGLKITTGINNKSYFQLFRIIYIAIPVITILSLIILGSINSYIKPENLQRYFFLFAGLFLLIYVPKIFFSIFHLTEDVITFIIYTIKSGFYTISISVNYFRPICISKTGIIISSLFFILILYGLTFGKKNIKIHNEIIKHNNLPSSFDGLRLVHISDLHLGSFNHNSNFIQNAVDKINTLQPDVILFTGDLVNTFSEEVNIWKSSLMQLEAKYGKYAVMGNHDYGNYYKWKTKELKEKNLQKIKQSFRDIGFRLLLDESEILTKDSKKIAIIGVENWGLPPFGAALGSLENAMKGTQNIPFKILLSHDPSHWEKKVINKTDIDLTLSGHTHGMQFGINIFGIKWSPVKYMYPRWLGLYKENEQYLYVNPGLGFIGFPGRIGIRPEITVIDLQSGKE